MSLKIHQSHFAIINDSNGEKLDVQDCLQHLRVSYILCRRGEEVEATSVSTSILSCFHPKYHDNSSSGPIQLR